MKKLMDSDGPVFSVLDSLGQLIVLSVLWLLCSLPIVTIFASSAALYDTVLRTVKGPEGNPTRVFWSALWKYLGRGTALSLILLGTFAALEAVSIFLFGSAYPSGVVLVAMILNAFVAAFAGPVLVRFGRSVGKTWKLAFVLSVQFAHYTLLLLAGAAVVGLVIAYIFPMFAVVLPGVWCWCSSFLTEKAMNRFSAGTGGGSEV